MRLTLVRFALVALLLLGLSYNSSSQDLKLTVNPEKKFQTMEGFGASLAFYETWLIAHPKKAEIYEAIFNELSLDILRVRNAYDYDTDMVNRVKEFINASKTTQGRPIPFLSTSWGPPAKLKSNNDRKNGGTLKYTVSNGKVEFDYEGFANWWNASLDNYESKGISPTYISIQNEPDFTATWESCILNTFEKVNATDTLAGYNKALEAVHQQVSKRTNKYKIIGPETVGIGYNSVKNYLLHANTDLLDGIAHHLYHGVDENNPWVTPTMKEVGDLHPEIPHYQTEFDRGDWFSLAGLLYKSLNDENVVAYLYWALIWEKSGKGLVNIENPWNSGSWPTSKGYVKTKQFYAFKQFSAFIHPGWQRLDASIASSEVAALAFSNPTQDSASIVIINRSAINEKSVQLNVAGMVLDNTTVYQTSADLNCETKVLVKESTVVIPPQSITTIAITNLRKTANPILEHKPSIQVYPNPFTHYFQIEGISPNTPWKVYTVDGRVANSGSGNQVDNSLLEKGVYILTVEQHRIKVIKN